MEVSEMDDDEYVPLLNREEAVAAMKRRFGETHAVIVYSDRDYRLVIFARQYMILWEDI